MRNPVPMSLPEQVVPSIRTTPVLSVLTTCVKDGAREAFFAGTTMTVLVVVEPHPALSRTTIVEQVQIQIGDRLSVAPCIYLLYRPDLIRDDSSFAFSRALHA